MAFIPLQASCYVAGSVSYEKGGGTGADDVNVFVQVQDIIKELGSLIVKITDDVEIDARTIDTCSDRFQFLRIL